VQLNFDNFLIKTADYPHSITCSLAAVGRNVGLSQLVEDRQLGGVSHFNADLCNLGKSKTLAIVISQIGEGMGESLLCVLCNLTGLLVSAPNFNAVVRSIALHELGCSRGRIHLFL
jgi:hypothetical protein